MLETRQFFNKRMKCSMKRTPWIDTMPGENLGAAPVVDDEWPWPRDWELLFRAAEIGWARIGDEGRVFERRQRHFRDRGRGPSRSSDREVRRIGMRLEAVCETVAVEWADLYDAWSRDPAAFVFDDGFAVLFFVRLLWANETLLLRGHNDSAWTLATSLERAKEKGTSFVAHANEIGRSFLQAVATLPTVRRAYGGPIPPHHREAILQHYGFPTDLLDFTSSLDVALFFAEGGADRVDAEERRLALGAIYAVPSHALSLQARLVTLPPAIMRPSLQRAAFIAGMPKLEREKLERFKFLFRHQHMPVWNGLGGVQYGGPVGLGSYLFPASDPIDQLARELLAAQRRT